MSKAVSNEQILHWRAELADAAAEEVFVWAVDTFGERVAFASSMGLEDQVLTDMVAAYAPKMEIFTLDTGRLFPETLELIHRTMAHYAINIRVYFPETPKVEKMVNRHGLNLFLKSVPMRKRCCRVRKVEPLRRALSGLEAWICGLRREQSMTRADLGVVEWDESNGLVRINPLAAWTESEVWSYIRRNDVPYNVLHDRGFPSIGCACCTRPVKEGEDRRAGRWWWETPEGKECSLHAREGKPVKARGK